MAETKFKVGEFVYLKVEAIRYNEKAKKDTYNPAPTPIQILETHVDTCYGGVQISYSIRMFMQNGTTLVRFFEIELTDCFE